MKTLKPEIKIINAFGIDTNILTYQIYIREQRNLS